MNKPDYMSVSEEKHDLRFSVMDKQLCSYCYVNDVGIQCQCGQFICEACVPWNYKYEEKISVIESYTLEKLPNPQYGEKSRIIVVNNPLMAYFHTAIDVFLAHEAHLELVRQVLPHNS